MVGPRFIQPSTHFIKTINPFSAAFLFDEDSLTALRAIYFGADYLLGSGIVNALYVICGTKAFERLYLLEGRLRGVSSSSGIMISQLLPFIRAWIWKCALEIVLGRLESDFTHASQVGLKVLSRIFDCAFRNNLQVRSLPFCVDWWRNGCEVWSGYYVRSLVASTMSDNLWPVFAEGFDCFDPIGTRCPCGFGDHPFGYLNVSLLQKWAYKLANPKSFSCHRFFDRFFTQEFFVAQIGFPGHA